MSAVLSTIAATSALLSFVACSSDDGGPAPTAGSAASAATSQRGGDPESDCRFERPACVACIDTSCSEPTQACYGDDWVAADLCSGTASAACRAASASEGLSKQTAYAKCVGASCSGACAK